MTTANDLVMSTPRGMWAVEAKHGRPGGDVDVVMSFRATGTRHPSLYGFRRDQGAWTQLAGVWPSVPIAVKAVASATRLQVLAVVKVLPLLDTAAGLSDFPSEAT